MDTCKGVYGHECVFPFKYQGIEYDGCTWTDAEFGLQEGER